MKILVLTDNFVPEVAAPSFRVRDHAAVWLDQGHEVTVVTCAPNWPNGELFDGYANRPYQEEWVDGVRVIRVWSYMAANRGFFRRTLDYFSYCASATAFCPRYPDFDVLLATSPQFFTALAGWLVARIRRRPWVFEVRDLWPASLEAVGAGNRQLIGWLERLELFLYRRSNRIVVLTRAFKEDLVQRGVAAGKIDVVTNGVALNQFSPTAARFDARRRLGIPPEKFLAGYVGTTGMAHGLETLLEAAALCRDHPNVHLLIMGEGARRDHLRQRAADLDLSNLTFANSVPQAEVPAYLAALDVGIVHLRPSPLFETVIPSKLFEFMAMGVPVLLGVAGESADIVTRSGAGVCIRPGDARTMADTIVRLAADFPALRRMSQLGRQAAMAQFNRRNKALHALDALLAAARGGSVTEPPGRTSAESAVSGERLKLPTPVARQEPSGTRRRAA
jgi:glycosyltransferase involved in cell wall biosynthesis